MNTVHLTYRDALTGRVTRTETVHLDSGRPALTWRDIAAALVVTAAMAAFYVAAVILGVSL